MFNLADYQTVAERLEMFWKDNPDGRIETELVEASANRFIVKASIFRTEVDPKPWATGLAFEIVSDRGVNSTSALENCESSALGRSLANAGYSPKGDPSKRASREEMSKVAKAETVKATIDEVKAKMAQTSKEYVPVQVEDDPWTRKEVEAPKTIDQAVDLVKSIIGGQTEKDIPHCEHGERIWATGTSKAGKPYGMMKCTLTPSKQCPPIWYEIKADGSWGPQENKF